MKSTTSPFPFELITLWVRPQTRNHPTCMFCGQPTTHVLYPVINMADHLKSGLVSVDKLWSDAIRKQVNSTYDFSMYQPACGDCTLLFASIQLGKRVPIQQLLTLALHAKKQQNIDLALVVGCTVKSFTDEGDTWAKNVPDGSISDVVRHIKANK